MESLFFEVKLLLVLFLSGVCVRSSFAFPQYGSLQRPQFTQSQSSKHHVQEHQKVLPEEREKVNTVSVTCHPDSLEILIKADLFEVGAPVNADDLRLGVEYNEFCRATATSREEHRIVVGLLDCGTKHWMTEHSLVYTNLLIYSPEMSPDGVIRMDEAVIPIECHYERRYSLTSSSLVPTWTPYISTQAAVETLEFDLRIMTTDFLYERGSNVFYLGEPIGIEASVRVGHHMGLRVFMSSCVATLYPDIYSDPKYTFIENGCLVDSQIPGSRSHFLPRTQDDKLYLVIDAFKFHNEDKGELYITCHLNAVPVNDAEAPNQACTLVNGRWHSADGNDYLCGYCQSQNEMGKTHSKQTTSGKFTPRGFGKPNGDSFWKSGLKSKKVWEQEARVGPMLVLPAKHKSGPLPVDELPPVLNKISRPTLYGSQWKSGIHAKTDLEKGLLPDPPSTLDKVEDLTDASEQNKDGSEAPDKSTASQDGDSTQVTLKSKEALNSTTAPSEVSPTTRSEVAVTTLSNTTAAESDLLITNDPKR